MSLRLPNPKPYWEDSAGPMQDYKSWKIMLDGWLSLQNVGRAEPLTNSQKNHMLLLHLGGEGARIFSTNPILESINTNSYEEFSQAVTETFSITPNPVKAHFDLFHRRQGDTETVAEYLSALRMLTADCEFCTGCTKTMLATMLVVGCNNKQSQERLLTEKEINFDRFITILKADESARDASEHLQAAHTSQVKKVNKYPKEQSKYKPQKQVVADKKPPGKSTCLCCGGGHERKREACPANGQTCLFCGKEGHFAKLCFKKKFQQSKPKQNEGQKKVNKIDLLVLKAEVDSASDVTTIPLSTYTKLFGNASLPAVPAGVTLSNYDRSPLPALGVVPITIDFKDRSARIACYVMPEQHQPVVGKDAMHALGLQLDSHSYVVSTISASSKTSACFKKFPNLAAPGIGKYPGYQHVITLKRGSVPKVAKLRSIPLALREAVLKEVQKMVDDDIWEPCEKSEWVHGMVVIPKPTPGQVRITTDLSPLNKDIVADHYPMPTAEDLFLRFKGCSVFTRLDLSKAYFHIELAPESRDLTATITPSGIYRYKRLLMGMTDSGSVFQSKIDDTLKGMNRVAASMDDILIGGESNIELEERVEQVLKRLSEKDFRVNVDKCEFNKSEVVYLGQIITGQGIRPNPRRIEAIKDAPAPKNKGELQSFLGFVNFYNSSMPNLASLCEPLLALTRKDAQFSWSESCQTAFEEIKAQLCSTTLKAIFDPDAPTILATDASDTGIGAALLQTQGGREVPISFASRTLQPAERNYATNEAEALACVWGCERFEKFLLGRPFTLRTDHAALEVLLQKFGTNRKSKKFHRWFDRLQPFTYTVEYRSGAQNVLADALSRLPIDEKIESEPLSVKAITKATGITLPIPKIMGERDSDIEEMTRLVRDRNAKSNKPLTPWLQSMLKERHDIYEDRGVLFRRDGRIILPKELIKKVMCEAHKGHPGIGRMKRALRSVYWWPGMSNEIERFVKFCTACQRSQKSVGVEKAGPTTWPQTQKPFERLAIDITGPFDTAPEAQKSVVVVIDHYSSFPFYLLTTNTTTSKIIAFLESIFSQYGYPGSLMSDNGPQFKSEEFTDYLSKNGIKQIKIPVYSPQTNGRVESFNRYIKFGTQTFQDGRWEQNMMDLVRSYRAIPLEDGGKSPSEMLHGWGMRLPFKPVIQENIIPPPAEEVSEAVTGKQDKKPIRFATRGPYRKGHLVKVRRPKTLKGRSPWSEPLKVTEVLGDWTYKLSDGQVWNARAMRRYREDNPLAETDEERPAIVLRRSQRERKKPDYYQV